MIITNNLDIAVEALEKGKIIAYPTEAVFGLGCDPFNEAAVLRLLALKSREPSKGLILIAKDWAQVSDLAAPVDETSLERAQATWPGPATWIFPASAKAPHWITGEHPGIALRVTQHPIASALCQAFGGPVVSTSANPNNAPPAKDIEIVQHYFPQGIQVILKGPLGDSAKPTPIREVETGKILRA